MFATFGAGFHWGALLCVGELSVEKPVCAAIPAGYFQMGCEQGRDEEQPVHRVWVDGFEMAVYQVRNRDYAASLQRAGLLRRRNGTTPISIIPTSRWFP